MTQPTKGGQSPGGPIIDQTPPRPAQAPADQRWSDADLKPKLSPTRVHPAVTDPYGTSGLPGLKSK